MDIACSFRQSNLFHSSEVTGYSTSDHLDSHLKFRFRCIGYFDNNLWGYNSCGSLICNFVNVFKTSRGVVRLQCQGNDSIADIDLNNGSGEEVGEEEEKKGPTLDELREFLQKALKELEVATMFEEKAQRISEAAIALKDEAANAWDNVNSTRNTIQEIVNEETIAQKVVQKATMALSLAEARLQVAVDSLEAAKGRKSDLKYESGGEESNILRKDEEAVLVARDL
ncbi:hypothetical protein CsSME_00012789 [Camellia sinensis var. sinensis]